MQHCRLPLSYFMGTRSPTLPFHFKNKVHFSKKDIDNTPIFCYYI